MLCFLKTSSEHPMNIRKIIRYLPIFCAANDRKTLLYFDVFKTSKKNVCFLLSSDFTGLETLRFKWSTIYSYPPGKPLECRGFFSQNLCEFSTRYPRLIRGVVIGGGGLTTDKILLFLQATDRQIVLYSIHPMGTWYCLNIV